MQSTDVVIAGGGLMGLTSAYYLAKQGMSVRLLDAGLVGRQASWAGGGILWPLYAWHYPEPVQTMAQAGRRLFPGLCDDLYAATGIDPQYRECGLLLFDQDEMASGRQWCAAHEEAIEMLGPAEIKASGEQRAAHAMWLPGVAQVRNPRLCQSLAAALAEFAVSIHEHEAVQTVVSQNGCFQGMQTARGFYPAKIGIVAAGAWTSQLVPALRLFPVKGQMLLLRGASGWLRQILLHRGRYAIPRADGYILIGSTVEHAGFDTTTDAATRATLHDCFDAIMPQLSRLPLHRHWAGLRPATADGVPLVGPVGDTQGLYVNAGHYRNGVVTAPASAALLTRLIDDNSSGYNNLRASDFTPLAGQQL